MCPAAAGGGASDRAPRQKPRFLLKARWAGQPGSSVIISSDVSHLSTLWRGHLHRGLAQLIAQPLAKCNDLRAPRDLGPLYEKVAVLGLPLVVEQLHERLRAESFRAERRGYEPDAGRSLRGPHQGRHVVESAALAGPRRLQPGGLRPALQTLHARINRLLCV